MDYEIYEQTETPQAKTRKSRSPSPASPKQKKKKMKFVVTIFSMQKFVRDCKIVMSNILSSSKSAATKQIFLNKAFKKFILEKLKEKSESIQSCMMGNIWYLRKQIGVTGAIYAAVMGCRYKPSEKLRNTGMLSRMRLVWNAKKTRPEFVKDKYDYAQTRRFSVTKATNQSARNYKN